eukprot:SAG31_NODE_3583_length_4100_cov_2.291427_2_plen_187_part_00
MTHCARSKSGAILWLSFQARKLVEDRVEQMQTELAVERDRLIEAERLRADEATAAATAAEQQLAAEQERSALAAAELRRKAKLAIAELKKRSEQKLNEQEQTAAAQLNAAQAQAMAAEQAAAAAAAEWQERAASLAEEQSVADRQKYISLVAVRQAQFEISVFKTYFFRLAGGASTSRSVSGHHQS